VPVENHAAGTYPGSTASVLWDDPAYKWATVRRTDVRHPGAHVYDISNYLFVSALLP